LLLAPADGCGAAGMADRPGFWLRTRAVTARATLFYDRERARAGARGGGRLLTGLGQSAGPRWRLRQGPAAGYDAYTYGIVIL
jgi:hypothetical protein